MIKPVMDYKLEPPEYDDPERGVCECCGREEYIEDMVKYDDMYFCSYACRDNYIIEDYAGAEEVKAYARSHSDEFFKFLMSNSELMFDDIGNDFERFAREFCKTVDGFAETIMEVA